MSKDAKPMAKRHFELNIPLLPGRATNACGQLAREMLNHDGLVKLTAELERGATTEMTPVAAR